MLGATGFVGGAAARQLTERGRAVIGASRGGSGADLACDIRIPESVDRALARSRPGAILLTAGRASITDSWENPQEAFRTNTAGTFNVLESARRLAPGCLIVFASSAGVYGTPPSAGSMPFTEGSPLRAASPYAASKAAAEVLCHQFGRQNGQPIAICRIFNQVGPGQGAAQAPAEFSREIALAERRGERLLRLRVGNPEIERDFTDVRDTARALAGLIDTTTTGTFNVCSGAGVSLSRIVAILAAVSRPRIELVTDPARSRETDALRVYGSNERLSERIGWRPEIPLEQSLADLLDDWRGRI